ncbi:MAG: preprotein translocase subunit SecE [Pirellulaceae bacterium]|jgi:preprotein translocase subunit SecE
MSKEKAVSSGSSGSSSTGSLFLQGLFQLAPYKPSQGRVVRQVTWLAMAIVAALAAFQLYIAFGGTGGGMKASGLAALVCAIGCWLGFRTVNFPRFADFLIAVEAEMKKVSWPTKQELKRSSVVVIIVILMLAIVLFLFDTIWVFLFDLIK